MAPVVLSGGGGGARPLVAGGPFARLATWSGLSVPILLFWMALLLQSLGDTHLRIDEFEEAERMYREALAVHESARIEWPSPAASGHTSAQYLVQATKRSSLPIAARMTVALGCRLTTRRGV